MRFGLALLLCACSANLETAGPPSVSDWLDRQCSPREGCPDDLLCVRLFAQQFLIDGGLVDVDSHTCHLACAADRDCPPRYVCFLPEPAPMRRVCVRAEVAERLMPDGGR